MEKIINSEEHSSRLRSKKYTSQPHLFQERFTFSDPLLIEWEYATLHNQEDNSSLYPLLIEILEQRSLSECISICSQCHTENINLKHLFSKINYSTELKNYRTKAFIVMYMSLSSIFGEEECMKYVDELPEWTDGATKQQLADNYILMLKMIKDVSLNNTRLKVPLLIAKIKSL
jgi:hypothetical protein